MGLFYKKLDISDFKKWEKLAKPEFRDEDFCSAEYLTNLGKDLNGWVLLNENNEWIGCCYLDFRKHKYNKEGVHFLEYCVFPQFRGNGYSKYLVKIILENSIGFRRSAAINPANLASIAVVTKYGFVKILHYKIWDIYMCDKNYNSEELANLSITLLP